MHINSQATSLVILGVWNNFYFTTPWLSEHLFSPAKEFAMEMQMGVSNTQVRIFNPEDRIYFVPIDMNRVSFSCENSTDDNLKKIEQYADKYVQEAFTPLINGYGFNLEFIHSDSLVASQIFDSVSDNNSIIVADASIDHVEIKRVLKFEGMPYVVNYTLTINGDDTVMTFNYHHDCNVSSKDFGSISGRFIEVKEHCIKFIKNAYKIDLD